MLAATPERKGFSMSATASTTAKKSRSQNVSNDDKAALDAEIDSTEPQNHPFTSVLDPLFKHSEMHWTHARNANAFLKASTAALQGTMQMFQETSRFVSERLKKDVETARAFTTCRTGEDYFRVQSAYFDEAVRDYGDEAAKVAHIAADVTQTACKPLEDRTKEALHSIAAIPDYNSHFV